MEIPAQYEQSEEPAAEQTRAVIFADPEGQSETQLGEWSRGDRAFADTWDAFVSVAGKHELLTAEEEITLAQRIERGDLEAKDRMVTHNLRLVMSRARRYEGRGRSMLDMCQDGTMGLIRGVEKFDWRRGYKFSTYGTLWIDRAIQREMYDNERLVRRSRQVEEQYNKVRASEWSFEKRHGRMPSVTEIAEATGLSESDVDELKRTAQGHTSLNRQPGDENEAEYLDLLESGADVPAEAAKEIGREVVRKAVDSLRDERKRVLVTRYFGLSEDYPQPAPVAQIARELKISQMHGSRLFRKALEELAAHPDLSPDLFNMN